MLVEKSRSIEVIGEVITDDYAYGVIYNLDGNILVKLNCTVKKRVVSVVETPGGKQNVENLQHVGSMSIEGGSRNVHLSDNEVVAPHAMVFEQILADVQASLPASSTARSVDVNLEI